MEDIKSFMTGLFEEILIQGGMKYEEAHRNAVSMSYAFGAMGHEEYMLMINAAFSGVTAYPTIDEFITTAFNFTDADLAGVSKKVYEGVSDYLRKNLGTGGIGLEP